MGRYSHSAQPVDSRGSCQQYKQGSGALKPAPEAVNEPQFVAALSNKCFVVGEEGGEPELDGHPRPRRSIAPKLSNIPVGAFAGEYTVTEFQVDFVGGAVLHCLLDLDDIGIPIDKRLHQCPRGVVYLDLARVQGRVIRRECVWAKSALVS